jgi:hypothetical protein
MKGGLALALIEVYRGVLPITCAAGTVMTVSLPVVNALDAISIPTPCLVPWDEMQGDDRNRLCATCRHQVHDVSELTTDEALALLRGTGKPPCLRIYRRPDGRVLTSDCATRRERAWKWLRRRSAWAASLFAVLFLSGCRTATQGYVIPEGSQLQLPRSLSEPTEQTNLPSP